MSPAPPSVVRVVFTARGVEPGTTPPEFSTLADGCSTLAWVKSAANVGSNWPQAEA